MKYTPLKTSFESISKAAERRTPETFLFFKCLQWSASCFEFAYHLFSLQPFENSVIPNFPQHSPLYLSVDLQDCLGGSLQNQTSDFFIYEKNIYIIKLYKYNINII